MLEDRLLILRFKYGSSDALQRIYEKYRLYLLKLAVALLNDVSVAEDVVHDVFLRFAQSSSQLKAKGSLKSYLRTCVINSVRNKARASRIRSAEDLNEIALIIANTDSPDSWVILKEESIRLSNALAQLPFEQREAIALHLHGDMKFKEIAESQNISIKTVQSRYSYGLEKLRSILNHEVEKCGR